MIRKAFLILCLAVGLVLPAAGNAEASVATCSKTYRYYTNPDSGAVTCTSGSGYLQATATCQNSNGVLQHANGNVVYRRYGQTAATTSNVTCPSTHPTINYIRYNTWD